MGKKGKKSIDCKNNSSNSGNYTKDSSKENMEKKGALVLTVSLMGTYLLLLFYMDIDNLKEKININ